MGCGDFATSPTSIWSEMISEQKLVLKPLCVEDAMVALWRHVQKKRKDAADEDEVMSAIKELGRDNEEEHQALKKLCGDEGGSSPRGSLLALIQAGPYMARFEGSFARSRCMFNNANRIEHMEEMIWNAKEVKLWLCIWSSYHFQYLRFSLWLSSYSSLIGCKKYDAFYCVRA